MNSSSRIISGLGSSTWRRWDAPNVGTDPALTVEAPAANLPTEQELQALRDAAFEKGFADGRKQGIESGRAEIQTQARLFKDLAAALARPFDDLDRRVEEELIALVNTLVRQLVRREIHANPEVVMAAVRESLQALPSASQDIRLVLHPEDAAIVRRFLADDRDDDANWKITENPGLSRGDCKVLTSTSQIDATVEHRLTCVINAVFGGERSADRQSDAATSDAETEATGEEQ